MKRARTTILVRERFAAAAICAGIAASSLGGVGDARAQKAPSAPATPTTPTAQTEAKAVTLFKEARALMDKGAYADACPKLEESLRIDPGMGTLFNLADCYEHVGRIASAWSGFRDVASAADAAGKSARAQMARERASLIESKVSKLRVVVSPEAATAGLTVQRNGVEVGRLLWGTDVPVDPGTYLMSASAPGMKPWSQSVNVTEPGQVINVTVPALTSDAPPKPPPTATQTPRPPATGADGALPPPPPSGKNAWPVILLGTLAVAGVGGGIGLVVVSGSKEAEADRIRNTIVNGSGADNECLALPRPTGCAELKTAADTAATTRFLSIGAFVLGSVGVAGAAIYLIVPPSPPPPPGAAISRLRVVPAVGASSVGMVATGAF